MTVAEKKEYLLSREKYTVQDLVLLVGVLRSEEGCPWDREQTHESIRKDFIEETYEVIEAIDTDNPELLREELGDVLLQVAFHAEIESEKQVFCFDDVANDICVKLIHRHPHVFGDVQADTSDEVLKNWEAIKSEEKARVSVSEKLRAIPPMLPALMRAQKVGKRASCLDFPDADAVLDKLREETLEAEEAIKAGDSEAIAEEIGDLLLTVTSLCRKTGVDAELCLTRATEKFINRFEEIENELFRQNVDVTSCTVEQLDAIWDKNKQKNMKKA